MLLEGDPDQPIEWEVPFAFEPRSVALVPGFNFVLWTGPDGKSIEDAVAGLGATFEEIQVWDPALQRFDAFAFDRPAFLNRATELRYGHGLWIRVGAAETWEIPAL